MPLWTQSFLIFLSAIFLVSCRGGLWGPSSETSLASASQESCGFVQNSYGARVSWKSNLPVHLRVDSQFPEEFFASAVQAADKWNSILGEKFIEVEKAPEGSAASPAQDLTNGLYWRKEWSQDKSNQQGITTLFFKGNIITEGDIKINAKDFEYYSSEPNSNQQIHMESLLVHEFGHLLGLKHSSLWPTVMWATLGYNVKRDTITEQDQESMKCEYK